MRSQRRGYNLTSEKKKKRAKKKSIITTIYLSWVFKHLHEMDIISNMFNSIKEFLETIFKNKDLFL